MPANAVRPRRPVSLSVWFKKTRTLSRSNEQEGDGKSIDFLQAMRYDVIKTNPGVTGDIVGGTTVEHRG
jgi:hypothetical protein